MATVQIHLTQIDQANTITIGSAITGRTHYGAGAPANGLGQPGDTYIRTTYGWIYQKTGVSAWTFRGAIALQITNTHAQFVCPDGQARRATLSNIP